MRLNPRFLTLALGSTLFALAFPALPSGSAPSQRVLGQEPAEAAPATSPPAASQPATPGTQLALLYRREIEADLPQVRHTAEEQRFMDLVNQERTRRGLGQLSVDPLLIAIARRHSAEMRDRNYFSHESPTADLKTPRDRYLLALSNQPEYACVGENLFYCSITDVQRGHNAFMNSPTHRDNVLFPHFEKIGVGVVKNAQGEFWVTQMYLTNTDYKFASRKMARQPK